MRLKNILIVVDDIERSKAFYRELFGLSVILDDEANVMLSGGFVLQKRSVWESAVGRKVIYKGNDALLYFEDSDLDGHIIEIRQC